MTTPRNVPVQMPSSPHGVRVRIPWRIHQKAWEVYGKHYSQTAERLAERGGFGLVELIYLLAGENPYTVTGDDGLVSDFFGQFPEDASQPPPRPALIVKPGVTIAEYNDFRGTEAVRNTVCPLCDGGTISTPHGPYCPKTTCKWGWETEMDGSALKPPDKLT